MTAFGGRFDDVLARIDRALAPGEERDVWNRLARKIADSDHVHLEALERELARTLADLAAAVCDEGRASAGAISAMGRLHVALACCGEAESAESALVTYDAWLAGAERDLGERTADVLREASAILTRDGKHDAAAHLLERATIATKTWNFPLDRASEIERLFGLALSRANQAERAGAVLGDLVDALDRAGSPEAMRARRSLGEVFFAAGRYDEARATFESIAVSSTGSPRRDALFSVARATRASGDEPEARALLGKLLAELDKEGALATKVGVYATEELTEMLLAAEDEDAIAIQRTLADATARALGAEHPRALRETQIVASILADLDRREDAIAILQDVREKQDALFGARSKDALATRRTLARALRRLDREEELTALEREIASLEGKDDGYEPPRVHFRGDEPADDGSA